MALRNQPFRPLPRPTGSPPYHLNLDDILPAAEMDAIRARGTLAFHIMGDTGGVRSPFAQQIVAAHLVTDLETTAPAPSFLYILGDLVYYYGEASEYYPQFYEPYAHYAAPIFAVPGNHDGDVLDASTPSLSAFVEAFCAPSAQATALSGEVARDTMTQPNVYWTLETPFATIIGLYSNVPDGGSLDSEQIAWLHAELESAPADRALIVAAHHPTYSADRYHGGSEYMEEVLDLAMQKSGRLVDAVFAGHVHNYQRYTRTVDSNQVPYIVAGAGGYWHLHEMQAHYGQVLQTPMPMPDAPGVVLETYSADRHGFLRVEVSPAALNLKYYTVPRPHESWRGPAELFDEVTFALGPPAAPVAGPPVDVVAPPIEVVAAAPEPVNPVDAEEGPTVAATREPRTSFGG